MLIIYIDTAIYFYHKYNNSNEKYQINNNYKYSSLFANKIYEFYTKMGYVNLNEVEGNIYSEKKWKPSSDKANEMNIGVHLDKNFILPTMITLASIMDSQINKTKIRFHIAIVLNFSVFDMIKIYSLRYRIREDTEFNFYNASKVEKDLIGLNTRGAGVTSVMLLPQLLPDDVTKLLIFDTGDLIVLRDLTEQYNWDMKDNMYVGVPGQKIGQKSLVTKQIYKNYINIGSFLVNVTKVKNENMYEKFVKYKDYYHSRIGEQDLLNDISFGKVGMYHIKFGNWAPFVNDYKSLTPLHFNKKFEQYFPQNITDYLKTGFTMNVLHQWNGKWMKGEGVTLFRRIIQYYIRYAGIWEETCKQFPGYCIK